MKGVISNTKANVSTRLRVIVLSELGFSEMNMETLQKWPDQMLYFSFESVRARPVCYGQGALVWSTVALAGGGFLSGL